ncbi:VOC family protein [Lysobacter silvisoli]|uniref:VOC family protein n=1 Tax=Lysobacter silvisoli TaxID=2293254 RepID=A0A371K2R7_9GAMM|nr:VOC family protein [Lysobacter silvisoli]RDZ28164.1 VOC family protein [Lysobacter silvisoli]
MPLKVMAQLAFDGDCRQAFEWYAEVFDGEIAVMNSLGGTPGVPLPPGSKSAAPEYIRYAEVRLGDSVLLGNDVPADEFRPMQGFNVALHARSVTEATRLFEALAEGGRVQAPLTRMPWAPRFGQLVDRYGTPWLILALDE